MMKSTTPLSVSMQPGTHLSVDSRPGTTENLEKAGPGLYDSVDGIICRNSSHLVKASIYVTSPFKQGPQRNYQDIKEFYDVSSPLKQEIIQSLSVYKQRDPEENIEQLPVIQKNKMLHARKNQGRLLPLLGVPAVNVQ